jgi:hypothetical protein
MAEAKEQYVFSHAEVIEALIKKQELHEGIWMIYFELGINGANIAHPVTRDPTPAAIIPIVKVGLQKTDAVSPIAVDAAVVNPPIHRKKLR